MARKLRGFERVLDAPALFAVAYGEIASSLYIALGIVAAQALGLTPLVLLLTGLLFLLVVSLSYAEGTAALPETGGAATFVRRAFNDLAGFVTGWALFLDYLIVMALSALFAPALPRGGARRTPSLRDSPWDAVVGCLVIAAIAGVRLFRHTRLHIGRARGRASSISSSRACSSLLGAGVPPLAGDAARGIRSSRAARTGATSPSRSRSRCSRTRASRPSANLAEEAREPGRTLPRSLFSAIGLVVLVTVLIAAVGLSAYPVDGRQDGARRRVAGGAARRHRRRLRRRASGLPRGRAADGGRHLGRAHPARRRDDLGLRYHPPDVLARRARLAAARVRAPRAARARLERGDPDRGRARDRRDRRSPRSRRRAIRPSSRARTRSACCSRSRRPSSQSSGCRIREPALLRPFRARPEVTVRGHRLPLAALVGAPATFVIWVLALGDAPGRALRRPALAPCRTGRLRGGSAQDPPRAAGARCAGPASSRLLRSSSGILVPMKLGDIGEEMVATAIAIAKESGAEVRRDHGRARAAQVSARGRAPARCRGEGRADTGGGTRARGWTTASRSRRTSCGLARSAMRSSRRRSPVTRI